MPAKKKVTKKKVVKNKPLKKVSKKTAKKRVVRKVNRRVAPRVSKSVAKRSRPVGVSGSFKKRRINLVLRNLLFFIVLFVLSLVLYSVSTSEIYVNLFLLLSIILGFLSLAFVLILLVLVFMRVLGR